MGNCGSSVDCTATDQPVDGNPDVAGIGVRHGQVHAVALVSYWRIPQVLLSFVATTILTFTALVVGYLSDSLPDTSLSQLDRACIAKFSSIRWRPWVKDGPIRVLLRRSMTAAVGFLGWDSTVANHDKGQEDDEISGDARGRRSKGLEKFILALSDQQLVTGLAVLIAGFVSPYSMSIYHFKIIAALGWFSSTTHLSTLAVLRAYFIEHPRLRDWRVGAMLTVLALLTIAQVVTTASTLDNSVPFCCAFIYGSSDDLDYVSLISIIAIVFFLGTTYTDRIVRLYVPYPEWSLQDWLVNNVVVAFHKRSPLSSVTEIAIACSKLPQVEQGKIRRKLNMRQQYLGQGLVDMVTRSPSKSKAEQGILWQNMNERRRYNTHYVSLESEKPGRKRRLHFIVMMMMIEIGHSFLSDILTLLFGIVYGITQVFVNRSDEPVAGIVGSQNSVSFGQLVPLLLMLLPLFAAGEVYFERRVDMSTKPSDDKPRPSNLAPGKPFFPQKVGLADIFHILRLPDSTQPNSDDTQHTENASSLLQSPESLSHGVGGSDWIELQSLPTTRLRRPDTETGQRAPMTGHSESTRAPSRDAAPENGTRPAKAPKKSPSPWKDLLLSLAFYTSFQIILAMTLGGVPWLNDLSSIIILLSVGVFAWRCGLDVVMARKELKNKYVA